MAKITKEELQQPLFDTWRKSLDDTGKSIDSTNSKMDQLAKTYKELINLNEKGQKSIDAMMKSRKGLEEITRKTTETDKASIQLKKEQEKIQKQLQKERLAEIKLQKDREKAFDKFEKERQKGIKAAQKERQENIKGQDSYKKLGAQVKNASDRLKRLTLQYGENDPKTVKARENYDRLSKSLNKVTNSIKPQLNAYQKLQKETKEAREETRKLAAQFGVNDKRTIAARKAYEKLDNELKDVNKTTSNGRKSLEEIGDGMDDVSKSATRLFGILSAGLGFKELFDLSNEQDQINKRLTSSFGLQGDALANTRKEVQFLSQAYDKDINEVLNTATVLTNEFKISQEEAFSLMNQGFEKGADVRGEFLDQLNEYSTQFVNVGLSASEAIAVITQQEQKGVFSDKGVDAIKEAGIRLTEMPKATEEALAAIGFSGEEMQRRILSGEQTVFEATQDISEEISKLPENSKEVGQVLADVFGGAGEDAKGFVLELSNVSTELDDLEDTTTDYEKAQQEIIKQFVEFKDEALQGLVPVFTFLANNFKDIVSIAIRAARVYAIWRISTSKLGKSTIELSKALVKSNGNIFKMIRSLKDGKKGFEGAGKAAKSLNKAITSISFAIAIDMAIDFAIALWDIVTASEAVRVAEEGRARTLEIQTEAREKGVIKAEEKIGEIREQIEKEVGQLQRDFDAGRIKSQEEYNAKVEEATDLAREGIKQFVQNSIDEEARFNSVAGVKIKSVEDFNKAIKLQEFFVKLAQDRVEKLAKSSDDFFGSQIKSAEFNLKVQQQTLSEAIARKTFIDELINQGGEYRKELLDQGVIINHQAKIEKKNNSQRKEAHLTEIDLLKEINDLHAKRLELEQEESQEVLAQRIANIDRLIEKETELQMMRSAEEGGFDFTEIQRLSNERLRLRIEAIDSEAEHEINKLKDTLETSQKERREAIQKDFEDKIAAADNDAQLAEELKQELKKIDAIELAEQEVLQNEISNINNEAARSRVDLEQETKDEIIEINEELNDSLKRLTLDEIFEREANLKRLELLQDFTKDREEIEEEYTDFLIDQLERRIAAEKAAGEDTIDLELQLAELRRKGREDNTNETKEALEELLDLVKQYADLTFEEASKLSKEQQDLLEDEISAQEAVIESKKQAADQGNATAEESLKVEEEILEQKKEALKEEKKREEAIRQLEAFYTLVTQFLEQGDNAGVAAGKAAAGTLGIKAAGEALFNSLGGFYEGTDWKLGQEHTPFKSGKDGHVVRVDSEEGIANPSLMNMAEGAGLSSMDEVFNKAVMFQQLSGSSHELPSVNYYERNDSALLYALEQNNKLQKQIKQSIENNPSIIFKTEESKSGLVNAMAMGVKKGNITEWYRNKSRS